MLNLCSTESHLSNTRRRHGEGVSKEAPQNTGQSSWREVCLRAGRTKVIQRDTKTGHVVSKARFEARLGNLKIGPNDHRKVDLYTAFRAPYVLGMRWCDCARWLTLRQAPKAARLRALPMLEIVSQARISTIPKTAMRRQMLRDLTERIVLKPGPKPRPT